MRFALVTAALVACLPCCNLPDQQISTTLHLGAAGGGADGLCAMTNDVDWKLTDDPEFAKYKDDIDHVTLTAARLRITRVEPGNEATSATGRATLTAPDGSAVTLTSDGAVPIREGNEVTLALDDAAAQRVVAAALAPPYTVHVAGSAQADRGPCLFSFDVELDLSVTPKLSALVQQ